MCLCAEGIWCDGGRFCLCAEGIWCDGVGVFVLRASGVMGIGVFVC